MAMTTSHVLCRNQYLLSTFPFLPPLATATAHTLSHTHPRTQCHCGATTQAPPVVWPPFPARPTLPRAPHPSLVHHVHAPFLPLHLLLPRRVHVGAQLLPPRPRPGRVGERAPRNVRAAATGRPHQAPIRGAQHWAVASCGWGRRPASAAGPPSPKRRRPCRCHRRRRRAGGGWGAARGERGTPRHHECRCWRCCCRRWSTRWRWSAG